MRKSKFEGGGGNLGNYILKTDLERRRFLRTATAKGHTLFRCVPSLDPSGRPEPQMKGSGEFVPEEGSAEERLSDAFIEVEVCSFFGEQKLHMISEVVDVPDGISVSPASVLHSSITRFKDSSPRECPQEWHDWLSRKHGPPVLSRPSRNMFLQGILFEHQGKPIIDRKTGQKTKLYPAVLQLASATARASLVQGLTRKPIPEGAPEGVLGELAGSVEESAFGDIISPEHGSVIKVDPSMAWNPQIKQEQTRYDVLSLGTYAVPLKVCQEIWLPWESLLYFPTSTWLIDRMAETFSPEAVVFALEGTPYAQYISPLVKRGAKKTPAEHVSVPGAELPAAPAKAAPAAPAAPARPAPAGMDLPGFADDEGPVDVDYQEGEAYGAPFEEAPKTPPRQPGRGPEDIPLDMDVLSKQLEDSQRLLATMNLPKI